MERKKYELIPSDREGLFRIKALHDFSDVKKGDIGGYVEHYGNLSQTGNCWVYDNAVVRGNAIVSDGASVSGNAFVCEDAIIEDYASVSGNAIVSGNANVYHNSVVKGSAVVCNASVYGNACVKDDAQVLDYAEVSDKAEVGGYAEVGRDAQICGNAVIKENGDYLVFKNTWSSGRYFTWTRSNNMWCVGCFYGSGKELIMKAYKDSEESGKMYEMHVNFVNEMLKAKEYFAAKK